jgi:hypothetical protein
VVVGAPAVEAGTPKIAPVGRHSARRCGTIKVAAGCAPGGYSPGRR